jgi:hypothetical protein
MLARKASQQERTLLDILDLNIDFIVIFFNNQLVDNN